MAIPWLGAAVAGIVTFDARMVLLSAPLGGFYAWLAWLLSANHIRRSRPGRFARGQARFFDWLGLEWFTGPAEDHEEGHRRDP